MYLTGLRFTGSVFQTRKKPVHDLHSPNYSSNSVPDVDTFFKNQPYFGVQSYPSFDSPNGESQTITANSFEPECDGIMAKEERAFQESVRDFEVELEKEKKQTNRHSDNLYRREESGSEKAIKKIERYIDMLLERQEYDHIERLLNTSSIGGNSRIAYALCRRINQYQDYFSYDDPKKVPTPLKIRWANQLRAISGNHRIENYGTQVIQKTTTNRQLDDYMKYLDINNDEIKDWQSRIQSRILVIGGGNSPLVSQLNEKGITVPTIINIDPSFPDRNPLNESRKYPWNFLDSRITALLRRQKFDEAWALYSLPMYSLSGNDVIQFYHQALTGLKTNGILRVFPYNHFSCPDFEDGANLLSRGDIRHSAEQIVEIMKTRPDLFEVTTYSKKVKNFFSRNGFSVSGVKIRVLAQPEQVDSFFNHLNSN